MKITLKNLPSSAPHKITAINVKVGDLVKSGDPILTLDINGTNTTIPSDYDGIITKQYINLGDEVTINSELYEIEVVKINIVEERLTKLPSSKAKVVSIKVKPNDVIIKDMILMELEGNKGTSSVRATNEGILQDLYVSIGDEVSVGNLICTIRKPEANEEIKQKEKISKQADIVIIGAGPGGYVAAIYAAKHNLNVIVVEKGHLGGTCLNVGCIPTKTLVKSAEVYHGYQESEIFGVYAQEYSLDMKRVITHKDEVVKQLRMGIESLMKSNHIEVIEGIGTLVDNQTVTVQGENADYHLKAKYIILANGSKIANLPIPGISLSFVLNSTTALSLDELPKSITIVGGGIIGMEFAFIYSHFGVRVSVVEYLDNILSVLDNDVIEEITKIAKENNIDIYTNSKVTKIESSINNQAIVFFEQNNQQQLLVSEKVLIAIGRSPNFEGLEKIQGLELLEKNKGVKVNEYMQTSIPNIYAIGDLNGHLQLAHVASHQGIIAVKHLLGIKETIDYKLVPSVIFTNPEIAYVGINEKQAISQGLNIKISKFPFNANGKAITMNKDQGFVKIIKDIDKNRIIGTTIIGPEASSLINVLTLAIHQNLSDEELSKIIFPHPTTSETISEASFGLGIGSLHYHE